MRITTLVFGIALVHLSSAAYSQITLKEKNAPLEKVLTAIERQTQYVFLYDPQEVKMVTVTVDIRNATLQETLAQIFKNSPIGFTLVGNNVLLKKTRPENVPITTDIRIHGLVVDSAGQPIHGVTVFNEYKRKGTQTDTGGIYTLWGTKGDRLQFSFVGYKDHGITIGDQALINVSLQMNAPSADQVVVIGYGSSKKKDLTGAVSFVEVQGVEKVPFNTFDNALAGKAAGVQVTKTDGTPGGMVRVRVRGSSSLLGGNDPLYIIDGVPVQVRSSYIPAGFEVASPFANLGGNYSSAANAFALPVAFVNGVNSLGGLSPDDIESITVLKDASSTAIYGSKAANGVVIVTTKAGKVDKPVQVGVNYYSTVASVYRPPELLNAAQYKILLTEAARNAFEADTAGGFQSSLLTSLVLNSPSFFGGTNTDWIKAVTRKTYSNHASVSASGGGKASKYFSSISYDKTPGVVNGTDYQRISAKLNMDAHVNSKFRLVANLLAGFTNQNIGAGAYAQAILARPDWTALDSTGSYVDFGGHQYLFGDEGFLNPVALTTAINKARTASLIGSLSGAYAIGKDLHFRSTVSLNMQHYNQRNFLPSYLAIGGPFGNIANPGGIGSEANSRFADWFLENTLDYSKRFDSKNVLTAVLGQSYETTKYSYFRATASGYPDNTFLTGLSSASTPVSVAGDEPRAPQSYLLSFYARANYSYMDKYLFTFTGRSDGSSKFGPDNKFGYFPSGAVAWRISREKFIKKIKWVDDVKLRGSYGLTGNQNIGDQMYRTLYTPALFAGNTALIPSQLGNQDIKWETTKEADIGLDLSFFAGRLTVTVDYYNRQTSDGLLSIPIASSSSYTQVLKNAVGLRNRGFEISLGGDIVRNQNFRWSASVNVTWNKSLVTKLDARADLAQIISLSGFETTINLAQGYGNTALIQGKSLGLLAGYVITGVIKTPDQLDDYKKQLGYFAAYYPPLQIGDATYKLDSSTAAYGYQLPDPGIIIGNGAPRYFGGMIQEFSYKKFDLQCYFTFSHGGQLLWAQHHASTAFYAAANAGPSMLNRYTPTNTNADQPRLSLNAGSYTPTNLDIFSSSYFKLRSVTLNYHFDEGTWMKKAAIKNLDVFMSATNIFTITNYPGADPETSDDPYSVSGGYIDAGNYPATKSISLGIKAIF